MKNEFLIRRLERSVQDNPGNFQALFELGRLYTEEREYANAVRLLEKALTINPFHSPSRFEMGIVYTLMRMHEMAVSEWQKMTDEDGDLELQRLENRRQAVMFEVQASWEKYRQDNGETLFILFNIGFAYFILERHDQASLEFERVLSINPRFETVHYYLGTIAEGRGHTHQAAELYGRELDIRPHWAPGYHALAGVLLKLNNTQHAIGHLQRAIQLKPRYVKALFRLGQAYAAQGLLDAAVNFLRSAVEYRPYFAEAHFQLAQAYQRQFREDSMALAVTEYQRAIEVNPHYKDAHFQLGLLYKNLGKSHTDHALAELQRVVELDPLDGESYYYMGVIESQRGRNEEAVRHFERALEALPGHIFARYSLGQVYVKLGQYQLAVASFRRVLEAEPTNSQARNALGLALLSHGDLEAAIAEFKKLLDANPLDAQARYSFGTALFRAGRIHEAVEQYTRVADLNPNSPYAHFNLGASYAHTGEYQKAVEQYMKAASMVPQSESDFALNATLQLLAALGIEHAQQAGQLKEMLHQLEDVYVETVKALVHAIDARDATTKNHSHRVARISAAFAKYLGLGAEQVRAIEIGGYMHDVGKIGIADYVLQKIGKLTPDERTVIEMHPVYGVQIIENIRLPWKIVPMVKHHHEKWNGTGYPEGLKGDEIALEAQIVSVSDFFDALTSERPYKKAFSAAEAVGEIQKLRGISFSPEVVDKFVPFVDQLALEQLSSPGEAGV